MEGHSADPGKRTAQHLLAHEVLTMVHGEEVSDRTRQEHHEMRNPTLTQSSGAGHDSISLPSTEVVGQSWARVLAAAGLTASRSEATRMISSGAVYVASESSDVEGKELQFVQIKDPRSTVDSSALIDGRLLVRMGKWKVKTIVVVDESNP